MKFSILIFILFLSNLDLHAQNEENLDWKFTAGLSGPELLHAGLTYRAANSHLLGLSAGAAPSLGMIWTSLNLEHRLFIGRNSEKTNQKMWFFRQGTTFFPSAEPSQQFTVNLTIGKDISFRNINNGITIDAGVFHLPESEKSSVILIRSLNLWPALRFQFYFAL